MFSIEGFESWLDSVGLKVESTTVGSASARISVARGTEPIGEMVVDAAGGVFSGVLLAPTEVASLVRWMSGVSEDELWYWTSNGDDCFRVDDDLVENLARARRGGIGHPHGTPWNSEA